MVISLRAMAMMTTLCGFPRSFRRFANGFSAGLWHAATSAAWKSTCRKARRPPAMARLPFTPLRNRLGIDPKLPAQRRERSLRSLYCCSDGVRGRGASVTNLSHRASFHSFERITPSNRGIKHLMCFVSAINGPSPVPARTNDGVGYSAEHLVA